MKLKNDAELSLKKLNKMMGELQKETEAFKNIKANDN